MELTYRKNIFLQKKIILTTILKYSHELGRYREYGERVNNKYSSSVLGDGLQLRPQYYLDSLSFQRQKEGRNRFHLSTWWKQEGWGGTRRVCIEIEDINNGLVRWKSYYFWGNLFFRWLRPFSGEQRNIPGVHLFPDIWMRALISHAVPLRWFIWCPRLISSKLISKYIPSIHNVYSYVIIASAEIKFVNFASFQLEDFSRHL